MIHQAVKTFSGYMRVSSFASCNLNGFERFFSSWFQLKFSWRFLLWSIPVNYNTVPQSHMHLHFLDVQHTDIQRYKTTAFLLIFHYFLCNVTFYMNINITSCFNESKKWCRNYINILCDFFDTIKIGTETREATFFLSFIMKSAASRDAQAARFNRSI